MRPNAIRWMGLAVCASLLTSTFAEAQNASTLYFWNPQGDNATPVANTGTLTILGVTAAAGGVPWTLTDLGTPGAPSSTVLTTGKINQYTTTSIATGGAAPALTLNHLYKLTATQRINAFFGGDCCGNYGSFQVPSDEDASRRVGSSFTFWAPVLDADTQTWIFSRSAGTVTVTDTANGTTVATTTFTGARQQYQVPNADLAAQHFYKITSTNCLFSVEQSVINGVATIPAASGWDVGPYGMFAIEANFDGAYALYGYADGGTTFLVHDVTAAGAFPDVAGTVAQNHVFYVEGHTGQPLAGGGQSAPENLNGHQFVVTTTSGALAIWAGDDQNDQDGTVAHPEICGVSANGVYETIACMGDDITFDSGDLTSSGTTIVVNPRTLGGQLFVPQAGTTISAVDINGNVKIAGQTTTAADQVFSIPEVTSAANNVNVIITASAPVIVQTTGGNQMDDWGKYLIEVPGSAGSPAAPTITGPSSPATDTFDVTGAAPSGSSVTVFDSAGDAIGTVTAAADGGWSLPVTESGDGSYTFFANDSENSIGSPPSASFTVVALDAPGVSAPTAGELICAATFAVTGTVDDAADDGNTVTVVVTPAAGGAGTAFNGTVTGAAYSVPVTFPSDGSYVLSVTQTTPGGVTSAATVVDSSSDFAIAPLVLGQPSTAGQIYVTDTPLISGTAGVGDPIKVVVSQGSTVVVANTTAVGGSWSVNPALPAGSSGVFSVDAGATSGDVCDLAAATAGTLVIDTTPATIENPDAGSVLNTTAVTLTGSGVPGTSVVVSVNGTPETIAVSADGGWSTAATLVAGTNTVTATDEDATGGESATATADYTVETAPTVILAPVSGSTVGSSPVTIDGTAAPNTTVDLSIVSADGGTQTAALPVDGAGDWTTSAALTNGSYVVTATDVDSSGDIGSQASSSFTVDTTPPALAITAPADGSVTINPSVSVSGTGDNGSTIDLVLTNSSGVVIYSGNTTVAGGTWTVPIPMSLADDTYTASVTETNTLGNSSSASTTFTVDAAAPQTPTITAPTGTINDTTPTLTGTAAPDSTITVTLTGPSTNDTFTVTVGSNGDWSQPVTTPLGQGSYAITATATNSSGDTASVTSDFTVDTTPPAAPVIVSPAAGSTTTGTPLFSGTAEPDSTVTLTVTGSNGTPITFTATTNAAGQWSTSLPAGDTLPDGTATVSATATDQAGNTSAASATTTWTVSSSALAPPVIVTPANGSVTNDTTPTVTGTAVPNSTVTVTITGPGGFTETVTGTAGGTGSFSIPATALTGGDGAYTVTATATLGGQTSQASAPSTFTLDTTAPAQPTIISPPSGSTQASTTPTITGTAEPGSTVTVTINGAVVGTTVADSNGNWTYTPTSALPAGTTTVSVTATDAAGNVSVPSATDTFTIQPTAAQPTVTQPTNGQVLGTTEPTLSGTAAPGATVTVIVDGVTLGTTVANSSGTWTFIPSSPLGAGSHTVQVTESVAGSVPSNLVTFIVDTTAPGAPIILSPSTGQTVGQTFTVSGTGDPGTTIDVIVGGVVVGTAVVAPDGTWSTSVTVTGIGSTTITATATNGAGNTSLPSAGVTVTVVGTTTASSSSGSSGLSGSTSASGSVSSSGSGTSASSGASGSSTSLNGSSSGAASSGSPSSSGEASSGSTSEGSSPGSSGSSSGGQSSASSGSSGTHGSSASTGTHGGGSGTVGTTGAEASGSTGGSSSPSGSSTSSSGATLGGSTSAGTAGTNASNGAGSGTGTANSDPGTVGGGGCGCGNGGGVADLWMVLPLVWGARRRRRYFPQAFRGTPRSP